jgi:endonuclease III
MAKADKRGGRSKRKAAPLAEVEAILVDRYGAYPDESSDPVLDQLVWFSLSTRTTVKNCEAAYAALRSRYPSWGEVAEAEDEYVAACIRPAGLMRGRTASLKASFAAIEERFGELSLEGLRPWSDAEAEAFLLSLPGVGLKVARCVLSFGLGRPSFAVDAHIWRITRRLGWHSLPGDAPTKPGADAIQELAREAADPLSLHVALIRFGREFCPAGEPNCPACPLSGICPKASSAGASGRRE